MAVASLVLGIVAIVFSLIGLFIPGLIIGIVGIVLAVVAKKKAPSGMATAGLVCSIIGVVLCALVFIACGICFGGTAGIAACAEALS